MLFVSHNVCLLLMLQYLSNLKTIYLLKLVIKEFFTFISIFYFHIWSFFPFEKKTVQSLFLKFQIKKARTLILFQLMRKGSNPAGPFSSLFQPCCALLNFTVSNISFKNVFISHLFVHIICTSKKNLLSSLKLIIYEQINILSYYILVMYCISLLLISTDNMLIRLILLSSTVRETI